jgi:hypothetical protein
MPLATRLVGVNACDADGKICEPLTFAFIFDLHRTGLPIIESA